MPLVLSAQPHFEFFFTSFAWGLQSVGSVSKNSLIRVTGDMLLAAVCVSDVVCYQCLY